MKGDWNDAADCLQALFRGEDSDDAHAGGILIARAISVLAPMKG